MARNGYQKITNDADTKKVTLVSLLLFQWMNDVFKTGSKRALDENDFLPLAKENTSGFLMELLKTKWNKEKAKSKENGKKPKLWKSVVGMLSVKEVLVLISMGALYTLCRILQPLLLGYLIVSLMSAEPKYNYLLYGCALAMGINGLIHFLAMHQFDYKCELLGIRISSALKGLVYLKTLLLSRNTLFEFSTGRVIDLVSNDVQRLEEDTVKVFLAGCFGVLELVMATFSLVYFIGWQTLMGVIFLCFLLPYFAGLSYASAALRLCTAAASDRRISLMNQMVSGIRAIKTHAWEDEYREKIKMTRRQEINIIRKKSALLSVFATLEFSATAMATMVSVITLALTGQTLTPVNVFMLLAFINQLRVGFIADLANGLLGAYEAHVSLGRLEEFLLLEDLPSICRKDTVNDGIRIDQNYPNSMTQSPSDGLDKMQDVFIPGEMKDLNKPLTIIVRNLKLNQVKRKGEFILQDINFATELGSLTVITGPVGSGKSTLLSAIAGEFSSISGDVYSRGTLVYVPQIAWVFSGTIRENVLFGEPYDEPKYNRVIEACALVKDIQQFPDGDETVVGERGEVLSGGQQARVSLARTVYADADIYLLDDPLSAVDVKVGQHIFKKCVKGLLGRKTRVLTSHEEQHMKEADSVIVLYNGRVLGKGSFPDLKEEGILGTTVDPLFMKLKEDKKDGIFDWENEEKDGVSGSCGRILSQTVPGKALQISNEDRAIGVVSFQLYWNYFRSGVPSLVIFAVTVWCFITQAMLVSSDVWLSFLTKQQPKDQRAKINLNIYGCLVGASVIFATIRAYGFLFVSLRCSERLHDRMVVAVSQAPVLFFDSNPVGRIMNRFSKDVGCMDEILPKAFLFSIQSSLLLFSTILVPTVTNPWLLFVVVPMTVLGALISRYYLKTSRELKRLESICRSPIFSHISETLEGLETIRTRGSQSDFIDRFQRYQDIHNQSYIMVKASGRWLGVRLDLLSSLLTVAVALAAVLVSQDAAFAGLALVYVIQTLTVTQFTVRKTLDVENFMTSVERVMTYTNLDSEPGYKVERFPPEHWPHEGDITFQDVSLTYYPGGPQVLKKISLSITPGQKIGVAGRTGAGKSSFVAALMRMPDADGDIMVDGVPIKAINLQEARRSISLLGQNPVLFSGTLRKNLDIMEQFQDADLWRALENVQLKDLVESLEGQLDHELLEHGANVSVGERQLICLARVLLQQNKIIILDEPTAHVDPHTEQRIWNVVREKLRDFTVITIAHRLNTLSDCDRILVLKRGEVEKFDGFDTLFYMENSYFREMDQVADT